MNAAETLLAEGQAERTAIECGTESITYGALRQAVRRAAGAWRALGLGENERVLVFAPDGIDWVVAYLGAMWAGGVAVGLNSRLFEKELGAILAESGARFIWCDAASVPLLERLCAVVERPPQIVPNGSWQGRLAGAPEPAPAQRGREDPVLWIYTSGTTGLPKAVVHAQRVVEGCAAVAQGVLGLTQDDRLYGTSKLFFAYPLANCLFAGLRLGATVILDPEWPTAERAADICERHRPTAFFSVPTLYHKLLQAGLAPRLKAAGVRRLVSAGEALPGPVREGLAAAVGAAPVSGYGTSETLCLMLYTEDGRVLRRTPLTEAREAASDAGTPRRLWLRHPSVALGYWNRPEDQADGFAEGWFSPGDLFLPEGTGGWEFTGRTDDMMKISGQWVSTLGVEQALLAGCGDAVLELGVVGAKSAQGLGELAVCVVPAPGRLTEARGRLDAAIAALPGFKRPRQVRFVDGLPRTATGKLQRRKLLEFL
ncbi:MAG: AMP-binding protein [Rhodocyclales bacterium]|nr:AMP-binding protein [Rhodocyclales bacterium]